jgi:signal transduction histidine kinase
LLAEAETPATTRIELRKILFSVTTMIEKVRSEIFNLRTNGPDTFESSLRTLLVELGSSVKLNLEIQECGFSDNVEREILAISRELLRNSIKHSGASVIEITIQNSENGRRYSFKDNGKGIDPLKSSGFGTRGIQERCISIEGELTMQSNSHGTQFYISIPS